MPIIRQLKYGISASILAALLSATGTNAATLVVGQPVDVINLDPTQLPNGNYVFIRQVYDSLIVMDDAGQPHPNLASSFEQSEDGLTVTFKLRDAKFHSGRAVTAEDVVASFARYVDPAVGANLGERLGGITVSAVDEKTVEFKLDSINPGFLTLVSAVFIMDKDKLGDFASSDAGSGPFAVTDWIPGQSLTMTKFADYWDPAKTTLDGIDVRILPDMSAAAGELETGGIDIILNSDQTTAGDFENRPEFHVAHLDRSPRTMYMLPNVTRPPLDNKLVRQALNYAIDRQKIAEIAYPGGTEITCQPLPSFHWAYNPALADCAFDLEKAKALLEEANVGPIELTVQTSTEAYWPGSLASAQIMKEDMAKIGVTLNIENYEQAQARERLLSSNFQLSFGGYLGSGNDPQYILPSGALGPDGWGKSGDDEYRRLVTSASSTTDREQRLKDYLAIAEYLYDQSWLYQTVNVSSPVPMRAAVKGFVADTYGLPLLSSITLEE